MSFRFSTASLYSIISFGTSDGGSDSSSACTLDEVFDFYDSTGHETEYEDSRTVGSRDEVKDCSDPFNSDDDEVKSSTAPVEQFYEANAFEDDFDDSTTSNFDSEAGEPLNCASGGDDTDRYWSEVPPIESTWKRMIAKLTRNETLEKTSKYLSTQYVKVGRFFAATVLKPFGVKTTRAIIISQATNPGDDSVEAESAIENVEQTQTNDYPDKDKCDPKESENDIAEHETIGAKPKLFKRIMSKVKKNKAVKRTSGFIASNCSKIGTFFKALISKKVDTNVEMHEDSTLSNETSKQYDSGTFLSSETNAFGSDLPLNLDISAEFGTQTLASLDEVTLAEIEELDDNLETVRAEQGDGTGKNCSIMNGFIGAGIASVVDAVQF